MSWQDGEIVHLLAAAVSGAPFMINSISTATLSVVEYLVQMVSKNVAIDIGELKRAGLLKAEAKAREAMARAVEAENKANLLRRNDRISKAEERKTLAEAAKTDAQAKAILAKIEIEQHKAITEAAERLVEKIGKLNAEGGCIAVDMEALRRLLDSKTLRKHLGEVVISKSGTLFDWSKAKGAAEQLEGAPKVELVADMDIVVKLEEPTLEKSQPSTDPHSTG